MLYAGVIDNALRRMIMDLKIKVVVVFEMSSASRYMCMYPTSIM